MVNFICFYHNEKETISTVIEHHNLLKITLMVSFPKLLEFESEEWYHGEAALWWLPYYLEFENLGFRQLY